MLVCSDLLPAVFAENSNASLETIVTVSVHVEVASLIVYCVYALRV